MDPRLVYKLEFVRCAPVERPKFVVCFFFLAFPYNISCFCQAQFQLATSVQVQLRTEISLIIIVTLPISGSEMEYCASTTRMLGEEIWQIAERFVEVPANL